MRLNSIGLYLVFLALIANASFATQNLSEQLGLRHRGMGGAGRAIATTNDAIILNPAGMGQFSRFNLDADYLYRVDDPLHLLGLSLVDSSTGPLAGGIDFHLGIDPNMGNKSLSYLGSLALGYTVVENILYVGATGKYSFLPKSANDPVQVNQFGLDFGLLGRFPFGLSLAAVGYNLVPTGSKRLPLSVGFGAAFNIGGTPAGATDPTEALGGLTLAADWLLRDLDSPTGLQNHFYVGGEYLLFNVVPLRVGYNANLAETEHAISVGTGFLFKDFGLDGFYEQNVSASNKRSFGGAMRIFF